MDRLALQIVEWMLLAVRTGERLRGFVFLEAHVPLLVRRGQLVVAEARVAEHQVVICFQVFRIDGDRPEEFVARLGVTALEEIHPAQIVMHHAIIGILRDDQLELLDGSGIVALLAQHAAQEVMRSREVRRERKGLLQHHGCARQIPFLQAHAADVHPSVGIRRIALRGAVEGHLGGF